MSKASINLEGKLAIVTGGGAGIGRAIALGFAEQGADIAVLERIPERCEEVSAAVEALGQRCLALPVDVSDSEAAEAAIAKIAEHFGRIDILVNNVGGTRPQPFVEQREKHWRKSIDLNLISMLSCSSAVIPTMIEGGRGGSIINIASIEASRAAPLYSVYAACKAGMLNFTRTLALELAEHQIRVNALAPDYTDTPGLRGNVRGPVDPSSWMQPTEAQQDAQARRIPAGRVGIDTEMANAALFLASEMSSYVNGAVLPVDGGTWASSGWIRNAQGRWTLTAL